MESEAIRMVVEVVVKALATVGVGGIILGWLYFVYMYGGDVGLKKGKLRSMLEKQGIKGPIPTSAMFGNIPEIKRIQQLQQAAAAAAAAEDLKDECSDENGKQQLHLHHDWPSTLFPHFTHWINKYGPTFVYSNGSIHFLFTTDIEIVKEVNAHTSLSLGKPLYLSKDLAPLLGESIISTSGPMWFHQRKIIAPEFYVERVKRMISLMVESATLLIKSWESRVGCDMGNTAEINIYPDMKSLSADIISRACFGSNYAKGERIFTKLKNLQQIMAKCNTGIPGLRFLPTRNNREIWKLEEEINSMIMEVVKQREAESSHEKDLLQMILEGAKHAIGNTSNGGLKGSMSLDEFIVDNCKAIYFAGHETTAITATWCLMLLAAHPDWQARTRSELRQICQSSQLPDANMLRDMKILMAVIQETLRLYPPAIFVVRTALQDMKFKDIVIPKGMNIQIPIGKLQQDPTLWGADSHKFNPERFVNGILGATRSPQAYIPFGIGARVCVGQHFAMAELKVILCMLLLKFSFSIAPGYHHSPAFRLVVEPGNGVNLLVTKLPA